MSDQLRDLVWEMCHALLNGDIERAEDLAEQVMQQLEQT